MRPELVGLLLAVVAAAGDVLGGALATAAGSGGRVRQLGALGAGVMLGTCFLSLLPEVVEATPLAPVLVTAGFLIVFLAENVFAGRSHAQSVHGGHTGAAVHELVGELASDEPLITRLASWMAFAGLSVHALLDGVAIVVAWSAGGATGAATFFAVLLHKVPEGLSMSAIMLASARTRREASLAALALAILTILGALAATAIEATGSGGGAVLLALATGSLLYVAAADLLPMVNRGGGTAGPGLVVIGIVLVYAALAGARAAGLE